MSLSARCPAQAIGRDVVNKAREDRMFVLPHFRALLQLYSLFTVTRTFAVSLGRQNNAGIALFPANVTSSICDRHLRIIIFISFKDFRNVSTLDSNCDISN